MTDAAPTRRSHARGMTLVELMVVVAIIGLIAGAIAVAVFAQDNKAKIRLTQANAETMRRAADGWRTDHGIASCPTPEQLRDDKLLDRGSKLDDPWGTPFRIVCHDDETTVVSLGPDRKESDDDIVAPPEIAMRP